MQFLSDDPTKAVGEWNVKLTLWYPRPAPSLYIGIGRSINLQALAYDKDLYGKLKF